MQKVKFSKAWSYAHGGHRVVHYKKGEIAELDGAALQRAKECRALEAKELRAPENKARK